MQVADKFVMLVRDILAGQNCPMSANLFLLVNFQMGRTKITAEIAELYICSQIRETLLEGLKYEIEPRKIDR